MLLVRTMKSPSTACILGTLMALAAVQSSHADTFGWPQYRDPQSGVAFLHPPGLKVRAPQCPDTNGCQRQIYLEAPAASSATVFISVTACAAGSANVAPCHDQRWFEDVCHSFQPLRLGNVQAFQCITFGSAACHWSAIVLGKARQIRIMTPAANRDANLKASTRAQCVQQLIEHRGRSPIMEILGSLDIQPPDPVQQRAIDQDVAAMVRAAHTRSLIPWSAPAPEVDLVVRHGKAAVPRLIRLLPDDPDDPDLSYSAWDESAAREGRQFDWNIQQHAAVALCRIYAIRPVDCVYYGNRATREQNRRIRPFWLKTIAEDP
jgi:hypothetical protein